MKLLRPFLLPAACFAIAWTITFLASDRMKSSPPEPDIATQRSNKPRRTPDAPRAISLPQLDHQFRTRPMAEWAEIWETFASRATAGQLEQIPKTLKTPRQRSQRRDASNVLAVLATEELAMRAEKPLPPEPYAFAALAEVDPESAFRKLKQSNRYDLATATLRTLAWQDPAKALSHLKAMPLPMNTPRLYEGDAGEGGMGTNSPIAGIHAAWARRDPAAAAAAVMKLPLSERTHAAAEVAMSWVHRDGPAAVRFITRFLKAGDEREISRFRYIMRASFASFPAETAKLMQDAVLRNAMASSEWYRQHILKPWYDADPDGVVAWLMEPHEDDRIKILFERVGYESEATADLIRRLHAAGSTSTFERLKSLYLVNAPLARDLADELGIALPEDLPERPVSMEYDPEAACDRWIEALRQHGDPDAALAALEWNKHWATSLATRACRLFPEKAAMLAELLPASALDNTQLGPVGTNDINRFWPELGKDPDTHATASSSFSFPTGKFKLDPATTAGEIPLHLLRDTDVRQAMEMWAPYDFAAAREWLSRVPDEKARQAGEMALLKVQAPQNPVAVLTYLTSHDLPAQPAWELWGTCLHRLVPTGGDWQGWLAKMPDKIRHPFENLRESIPAEAKLLEVLRNL